MSNGRKHRRHVAPLPPARHVRLVAIARNEADALPELAEHVRPLIDSWLIVVDPRTTDDTVNVAYKVFDGIPGRVEMSKLTEETFDFAAARNEAQNLAKEPGVHLLILDIDSPCIGTLPDVLDAPAYVCDLRDEKGWEWKMPLLVRSDAAGPWHLPAHEYIEMKCKDEEIVYLPDIYIRRQGAGTNEARLRWTVEKLTEAAESSAPDASRAMFFLGNVLFALGETEKATECYIRRVGMDGSPEESFFAMYSAGRLLAMSNPVKAARAFLDAWGMRPQRAEPLFWLAHLANTMGNHQMAMVFANQGISLPPTKDMQFVERWVEQWGLDLQWAIAAHGFGMTEAFEVLQRVLDLDPPEPYKTIAEHYLNKPVFPKSSAEYLSKTEGIVLGEGTISPTEAEYLASRVRGLGKMKVAEVGFGRGWSAWSFLAANHECEVVSFDLLEHEGAKAAKLVLDQNYPDRHTLVAGDSKATVPEFGSLDDFDLVFIDGGHDYESAISDLRNFAKSGRPVIFDDYVDGQSWAEGAVKAWDEAAGPDGFIADAEVISDNNGHAWAVGVYR